MTEKRKTKSRDAGRRALSNDHGNPARTPTAMTNTIVITA